MKASTWIEQVLRVEQRDEEQAILSPIRVD
jgi:hypothetical protein